MVRRLFCLTLFAAAFVASASVFIGGPPVARAAAKTCVKHPKRVVTHVRRHGKRTRIVRIRHYRTCTEAPSASATTTTAPTSPVAAPPAPTAPTPSPAPVLELPKAEFPPLPPSQPEPEANAIGVAAEDLSGFRFTLSQETVKAGSLVVQLTNKGQDPHTMALQRVGPNGELEGPVLTELEAAPRIDDPPPPATVEVQPGTYRMWCTIGHHAEHGMRAEFTVE